MNTNSDQTQSILKQRVELIENFLNECLQQSTIPHTLKEAMNYSLLAGGKRLRAILCISTAELFGLPAKTILPFAAGIEMIHTYSLIHDDLPAMDNDDFRRGKPSCHKAFNEATAILAGDALLSDAFTFMSSLATDISHHYILTALHEVAQAAGSSGMVGGQIMDISYTGTKNVTFEQLITLHKYKTGALFQASCTSGAILAGANKNAITALKNYGTSLGMAFQITDDILNVTSDTVTLGKPVGSDQIMGKTTYPSLLGLEKSKELASKEISLAIESLAPFSGNEALFLCGLAQMLATRNY